MAYYFDFLEEPDEEDDADDCGDDFSDPCFFLGAFFGFLSPMFIHHLFIILVIL